MRKMVESAYSAFVRCILCAKTEREIAFEVDPGPKSYLRHVYTHYLQFQKE
jgi:hypothetical protein